MVVTTPHRLFGQYSIKESGRCGYFHFVVDRYLHGGAGGLVAVGDTLVAAGGDGHAAPRRAAGASRGHPGWEEPVRRC